MTVRSKFQLLSITKYIGGSSSLKFSAVYDDGIAKENAGFSKATPWGTIEVSIDNPEALAQYEIGKYYYFDSNPAE